MKVVAVYNVKGGVGKTTAAVNLAWSSSQERRTLLWDLDPQGGATFLLGVKPKQKAKAGARPLVRGKTDLADVVRSTSEKRLDVIPAHDSYSSLDLELDGTKRPERRLEKMLASLSTPHDVVVLDCPPGRSLLSEAILRAADVVVVPLLPAPLALRSLDQVTGMVTDMKKGRPTVVGFLSMVDRRKVTHRDVADALPRDSEHMVDVVVPDSTVVERMGVERAPLATFAPRSAPALAYADLWTSVRSALALTA